MNDPYMYRDMRETEFIHWSLSYYYPAILRAVEGFRDADWCKRPAPGVNPPGYIFCHIYDNEQFLIQGLAMGRAYTSRLGRTAPDDEQALRDILLPRAEMIAYSQQVRSATEAVLASLTDADLKRVPERSTVPDTDPNRQNPIREAFVMAIQHQAYHWGQLQLIARLLSARPIA